jgi:Fe-S-cluster containining protein
MSAIANASSVAPPAGRISCGQCEAVCCRMVVVLMPEDRVPDWLIEDDQRGFQTLAKNEEGWCAAIDPLSFRCTIYEDRPSICRKFAMGSAYCREARTAWYAPAVAPADA